MKRILLVCLLTCSALTACQMEPKTVTGSFGMRGNYQAVADCSYLELRKDGANMWRKDDLPSQNTVMVTLGMNESTVGRIDFIGTGPKQTTVNVYFANKGWVGRFEKQLAGCNE
jgi:hypothetical protein